MLNSREIMKTSENIEGTDLAHRREEIKQYIAALAAAFGAFTAGTILSWTSPALPVLQNSTMTVFDIPISEDESMWIGSLLALGALVGAFPTGYLAKKIGRKYTMMSLALPFTLSWLIIVFATRVEALYAARFLAGYATGGVCVVAPVYIAEVAETSIRGTLGSYFQLLLTIGVLFTYVLGALVNYIWLAIMCSIFPSIFFIFFYFMPETPFYLLSDDQRSLAIQSIKWLRGEKVDVSAELDLIEDEVCEAERSHATFSGLFSSKASLNALKISLGLMFFQQFSGINAVIFYTAKIFEIAGSDLNSSICAMVVGIFQVFATCVATLLVDRVGRKLLLLISSGVMSFCLFTLGIYFHLKQTEESSVASIGWLPLLSVTVYVICFSLGFGPLPWMMLGELFATSIKGLASSLAVALNWSLVFIVTKTFQNLISAMGTAGTFWFFGSITGVAFIFVWLIVKETKGKNFAEIQKILSE